MRKAYIGEATDQTANGKSIMAFNKSWRSLPIQSWSGGQKLAGATPVTQITDPQLAPVCLICLVLRVSEDSQLLLYVLDGAMTQHSCLEAILWPAYMCWYSLQTGVILTSFGMLLHDADSILTIMQICQAASLTSWYQASCPSSCRTRYGTQHSLGSLDRQLAIPDHT